MSGRSRKPQRHGKLFTIATPTSQGDFLACYSGRGLCALWFPGRRADTVEPNANGRAPAEIRGWHKLTVKALDDCLAGRTPNGLPPLDLSVGTEFQQEVWRALVRIGLGATMSYGEVALAIGKPKALRAVGGACGANPIPVFVPCHRVLAANGKIGGFSAGLEWKRKLLGIEELGQII